MHTATDISNFSAERKCLEVDAVQGKNHKEVIGGFVLFSNFQEISDEY